MSDEHSPSDDENRPGEIASENIEHDPATNEWLLRTEAFLAAREDLERHKGGVRTQLNELKEAALAGDAQAIAKIYETANLAAITLEELRASQPTFVAAFAAKKLTWPVGLAAYQTIGHVKNAYLKLVEDLKLGTKIDSIADTERVFKKFNGQNIVRETVVLTIKRIESIRRIHRDALRLGWYVTLREGGSNFTPVVVTNNDPVAQCRVDWALKLPPLEKAQPSCEQWIMAVKELLILECDGYPEKDPRFRVCGEPGARSRATSYKAGAKGSGELLEKSFEANIRDEILDQVENNVRYLAPSEPTEGIDDYLPPKTIKS